MPVLAHAADWISLAAFVPVVGFLIWLGVSQVRLRREQRQEGESEGTG